MKLTAILIIFFCAEIGATGHGYGQKVTINRSNANLEDILLEINKQTGYSYSANAEMLQKANRITINANHEELLIVLEKCFKNQPLAYLVKDNIIIVKEKTITSDFDGEFKYPIDVKGRIVDEHGLPVIATITAKGTDKVTGTNMNGEFELKGVDDNATLHISGVNIESFDIQLKGRTELRLSARIKITQGEEVVVANTGYQSVKPNEINGSVVVVSNEMLNEQTGTNILDRLDGITSGLLFNIGKNNPNPQSSTNIIIRGHSTINGPLDPLIVLDNFPYEGNINNINPNDVESITILKDAAATSIWGARGGNGVIVITTKKGRFNKKLRVELNSNIIIKQSPDLFYYPDMSSSDYIDVEEYLFNKGYFNSTITNTTTRPGLAPASEIFLKRRNGLISPADSAAQINDLKATDIRDQFNKYLYQNAVTQQYALNLRGGSGNIAWFISGSYDKAISSLQSENDKINLRIGNTYRPVKNLQIDLGIYYTNRKLENSTIPSYNAILVGGRRVPYLRLADDNGNALSVARYYREGYTDTAGTGKLLNWKYYPLEDYKHDKTNSRQEDITANFGLNYQVLKGLSISILYQYQKQKGVEEDLSDMESFYARDIINRFSQLNRATGIVNYIVPKGAVLNLSNDYINSQALRGQMNFENSWNGKRHFFSAIAGGEIRQLETGGNDVTYYGYRDEPLVFANIDFITKYPLFNRTTTSNVPGAPKIDPTVLNRFVSLYANASYAYKERYTVTMSARKDGSNIFGATTNDKWNPLWSFGFGYEISKEKFYHSGWLPYLKVRYTLGYSGNVDLNKIPLPVGTYSTTTLTNIPYLRITQLNDPSLRWEKVKQANLGIDFSTAKGILSGTIEYYQKWGMDLYGPSFFNYTAGSGGDQIDKNVANMVGRGLDITLTSKNIDRAFKWLTTLLFNYRSEKTSKYFDPNPYTVQSLVGGGNLITPVIGKPLYAIAAYKWGGLNSSGDPQGYLNGILSTNYDEIAKEADQKGVEGGNLVYIGSAVPNYFGSLLNTISWKGFSASVNIVYKLGYYFKRPALSYRLLFSSGIGHQEFADRWRLPGDENRTNVPAMVYTNYQLNGQSVFDSRSDFYLNSEVNVLKADNIRVQFINVAYTFKPTRKKFPVESLQIYCNLANLGIIWRANNEKIDPDYPSIAPPSKSISFGLRASF